MKQTFLGKTSEGKLKIVHRGLFDNHIQSLGDAEVVITIEKKRRKRSNPQNSYYRGVVLPLVLRGLRDAGFDNYRTDDHAHDLLKYRFLKVNEVNGNGETFERIKSTTELSTSEMMDYIAEIQQFASEYLGVYIPDPQHI